MYYSSNKNDPDIYGPSKQEVTVPPTEDPITLQVVKDRRVINEDDDDSDIQYLIEEATAECELKTQRALITQTRKVWYDYFPHDNSIPLRGGPIQYIKSMILHFSDGTSEVVYIQNPDDESNDVGTDKYYLTDSTMFGAITLQYNERWDTRTLRPKEGIEVEYVCGYGEDPEDVPSALRGGIQAYVKHYYQMEESDEPLPSSVTRPWNRYKLPNV